MDVVVVNWNGSRFLPKCLAALRDSSLPLRVTVVDNASSDGSVGYLRSNHPEVAVVALGSNRGYADGANVGIEAAGSPYVCVLNPDVAVGRGYVERIVRRMDSDPTIGAAQGRLYRVSADDFRAGRLEREVLDSTGHVIRRTRMVFDRGQGEPDDGRWDQEVSIFSASGAAVVLRRAMLDDLAAEGRPPFDSSFFAYKEDIDLCWRARLLGWDIRYVPDAEAWHVRAVPGPGRRGSGAPPWARRHSWVNHWLMILKNDRPLDLLRHLPWVLGWEIVRVAHVLFRDPRLLPAYLAILKRIPAALRARRDLQARRRAPSTAIRPWFRSEARPPSDDNALADFFQDPAGKRK